MASNSLYGGSHNLLGYTLRRFGIETTFVDPRDLAASRVSEDDRQREWRDDRSEGRDLAVRLADQERDGVTGEVIYPNQSLFLYNSPDPGYQLAIARAYNDWAIELFGARRDR